MIARHPFSLLYQLGGDQEQAEIFSADQTIESWLATERALARAQGGLGVIEPETAVAIIEAAVIASINRDALWTTAKTVGYPILGLVRQIDDHLPPDRAGRVHYGATTQDIMDTGLALQLVRSVEAIDRSLARFGDALAQQVSEHAETVMPARTHGQQAVPTTFGASLATLLEQLRRQRERLIGLSRRVGVVSLFGAGGTNAAMGAQSAAVRAEVARLLGLQTVDIPWHVDRDLITEYGQLCASVCASLAKFGRNLADLSRTEIGEVSEPWSPHRGASSTMPQKVNPISSEQLIGISITAGALSSALPRIQEAGHERAAGEWQAEWLVVPQLGVLAGSALAAGLEAVDGLRVDADRMRVNLAADGGLIMAEAQMIKLAEALGRERAHDLVYEASTRARDEGRNLQQALADVAAESGRSDVAEQLVGPDEYLGEAVQIAARAVAGWRAMPTAAAPRAGLSELVVR